MIEFDVTKKNGKEVVKQMTHTIGKEVLDKLGPGIQGEVSVELRKVKVTAPFETLTIGVRITEPVDPVLRKRTQGELTDTFRETFKKAEDFLDELEARF